MEVSKIGLKIVCVNFQSVNTDLGVCRRSLTAPMPHSPKAHNTAIAFKNPLLSPSHLSNPLFPPNSLYSPTSFPAALAFSFHLLTALSDGVFSWSQ